MGELARSYRTQDKKWSGLDETSLKQAELAYTGCDSFKPMMILYQKVGVIYRGGHYMSPEGLEHFIKLIQTEMESYKETDVGARAQGLMIQAEVMRQSERWEEALQAASECLQLKPLLTKEEFKSGSVQVATLVAAFSQYAKCNLTAAQDMLRQLDGMGTTHFFRRNVDFKATHLRRLVGLDMHNEFTDVTVGSRGTIRLRAHVPEDVELLEWDFVLADHSITVIVEFNGETLMKAERHKAEAGPISGSTEVKSVGVFEVLIDNSFSYMRGKNLQYRLKPSSVILCSV